MTLLPEDPEDLSTGTKLQLLLIGIVIMLLVNSAPVILIMNPEIPLLINFAMFVWPAALLFAAAMTAFGFIGAMALPDEDIIKQHKPWNLALAIKSLLLFALRLGRIGCAFHLGGWFILVGGLDILLSISGFIIYKIANTRYQQAKRRRERAAFAEAAQVGRRSHHARGHFGAA